jgi:hypothetical protein
VRRSCGLAIISSIPYYNAALASASAMPDAHIHCIVASLYRTCPVLVLGLGLELHRTLVQVGRTSYSNTYTYTYTYTIPRQDQYSDIVIVLPVPVRTASQSSPLRPRWQ